MATITINREPFKTTNEWSTSVDGSVSLNFGNKKNNLTFQTFGNSNITISSKFKSEKTAISVKRDAISSVEVNTKTYPIWLIIAVLIFLYSAIMMFPELEQLDESQPVQQQQSHVHANVNTGQQQRSELPPPPPPHRYQ
jgi:hypothetical protein